MLHRVDILQTEIVPVCWYPCRHLKGEIFAVTDEMLQERESLARAQQDVASLHSQIRRLQETEEMMDANIRNMTDKYQILEENLCKSLPWISPHLSLSGAVSRII